MKPISYSDSTAALVELYQALPETVCNPDYWSRDEVSNLRLEIKKFYIEAQDYRCAYCGQQNLSLHGAVWDVDHIIPRSIRHDFMFVPENLAVACKDCNLAKRDAEVRVNPKQVGFPNRSPSYRIAHPHFDKIDEHVRWNGLICYALTEKGAQTIHMCKLYRFTVKKLGGRESLGDPFLVNLIADLSTSTTTQEAKAMVAAIARYLGDN